MAPLATDRERALGQHLRSVPILKDYVDDKIIEQLRNRVDLVEYEQRHFILRSQGGFDRQHQP